jgi:uncharacterized protein
MDAVHIPNLAKLADRTERFKVLDHLPDLETLTPIQGEVQVSHRGNYLEVEGWAETIVTLTCDRCLQQYNHRLRTEARELIWLQAAPQSLDDYPLEREGSLEELVETLPPDGYFYPQNWIYEQLCLALPQRQLCDPSCQGIPLNPDQSQPVDRRWASLEALKQNWLN